MIGTWDFDTIARAQGTRVLRECCGRDVKDATVDALVDETLAILAKVVRSNLNRRAGSDNAVLAKTRQC